MDLVRMFINGQALTGGSLHGALDGATLLGEVSTAAGYRFFAVRDEFPGLHPASTGGVQVPGELYEMPYRMLRESLLPREPPELELSVIELADGSGSLAMLMRDDALGGPAVTDISGRGGWKAYLAELATGRRPTDD